jgi:CBS domain-containing protein
MSLTSIGSRKVFSVGPEATAVQIAEAMETHNVGCVVVTDGQKPIGMVTDRDLALRVVARGLDPSVTTAQAILSRPLWFVHDDASAVEAAAQMREAEVRRLPILNRGGRLVGIVTLDDLIHYFGRAEGELAEIVGRFPVLRTGG